MLLTSSQVSIALSSGIVIIFTTALFLSGYAIQQRTLRDLRAAIKPSPRPEPKIFLPDRFKKSTTELPDGTIVEVEDDGRVAPTGTGGSRNSNSNNQKPLRGRARKQRQQEQQNLRQQRGKDKKEIIIEIKPTLPEDRADSKSKGDRQQSQPIKKTNKKDGPQSPSFTKGEKRGNDQQQRQAKIGKSSHEKGKKEQNAKVLLPGPDAVPHPDDEERFVSRAERRRLIKQELQRLSQGNERGYWQRRLW